MTTSSTKKGGQFPWNIDDPVEFRIENLGGISSCKLEIPPGVTILVGENATNRTSTLRAIASVIGAQQAASTVKSDCDTGRVTLQVGENQFNRSFRTSPDGMKTDGAPLSTDASTVDTFVALFSTNPCRRCVENGGENLRDILMIPVDTEQIRSEIQEIETERAQIQERIREIEQERERLPELEERKQSLRNSISELDSNIDSLEETLDNAPAENNHSNENQELVEDLKSSRSDLIEAQEKSERHADRLEELREEREELERRLKSRALPREEIERIDSEIDQLSQRRREVTEQLGDLETLVEFHEEFLHDDSPLLSGSQGNSSSQAIHFGNDSNATECWACGSVVSRSSLEERLDKLRAILREKRSERSTIEGKIESLENERADLEQEIADYQRTNEQLSEITSEIRHREAQYEALQNEVEALRDQISEIESRIDSTEGRNGQNFVDVYRELSEKQYKKGRLEQELTSVESEIETIEDQIEEQDDLEDEWEPLTQRLEALQNRIENMEMNVVEEFNRHMAEILEILGYKNISRVWIERLTSPDPSKDTVFELHIVRENEEGTAYEDSIDTLSESEREIIGLIVALAGYLVHEIYQHIPFMLLDSLEPIDAARINSLLGHFSDYVPYLILALLEEDASRQNEDFHRINADILT